MRAVQDKPDHLSGLAKPRVSKSVVSARQPKERLIKSLESMAPGISQRAGKAGSSDRSEPCPV